MGIKMMISLYEQVIQQVLKTEEQTQYDTITGISGGGTEGYGQILTIPHRKVSRLSFPLDKLNSPTGDITFIIRLADTPFTVISSKVWGDASLLSPYPAIVWEEVEFDSPQTIDDLVIIGFRFSGGDASNQVVANFMNSDVKANENAVRHNGTQWVQFTGEDAAYRYKYLG